MHNTSDLQEEKMRIATALGSVRKEELIKKVLNFALSVILSFYVLFILNFSITKYWFFKPSVRSQDSVTVICAVSGNTSTKVL